MVVANVGMMEDCGGPVDMTKATLSVGSSGQPKKRINKPLMERKRRARINQSLNELKSLVLDGMKKDPTKFSRLEKADILEMTVNHIKLLQKQHAKKGHAGVTQATEKYRSGFNECASEISTYLTKMEGVDDRVKNNLMNHVTKCLSKQQPQPIVMSPPHSPVALNNNCIVSPVLQQHQATSPQTIPIMHVQPQQQQRLIIGNVQLLVAGQNGLPKYRILLPKQDGNVVNNQNTTATVHEVTSAVNDNSTSCSSPLREERRGSEEENVVQHSPVIRSPPPLASPEAPSKCQVQVHVHSPPAHLQPVQDLPVQMGDMWRPW